MSAERLLVCACSHVGSIGFHNDKRETLVIVDGKLYELVPSTRTYAELLDLPQAEVPHVRHLNHIPQRPEVEQEKQNKTSVGLVLEQAKAVASEKRHLAKELLEKKAKPTKKSKTTGGEESMAKVSKIKQVIEALHHKALTKADMVAMGVSESTVATQLYALKRKGYTITESQVAGKTAYKIAHAPAAALAASAA